MQSYCDILENGNLVAIPTETVYGLGADATNANAVAKIYRLKQRPDFNPLIVHCHSIAQIETFAEFNPIAYKLAIKFWPGALTLVLPLQPNHKIAKAVTAGLTTIAVRIPNHPRTLNLLKRFNKPIAAPSANISGKISPTNPNHVKNAFQGNCPAILDGGSCTIGLESTIIGFNHQQQPVLLRAGGIPLESLEYNIGTIHYNQDTDITAPGQLSSHYAPNSPVILNSLNPAHQDGFLAFGNDIPKTAKTVYQLSKKQDLFEAAANLFDGLHFLDTQNIQQIHVAPIPNISIGHAIIDRLTRAATEKNNQRSHDI
ncbi:MAG: L-threonylcarbamoyladenylate synthase [Alphaproteobacteria bacterium]|jgi:L-threonylcarbamoyladenylate synthase